MNDRIVSVLFVATALITAAPGNLFADLVHHYQFDLDASDAVRGNDGTLVNGASIISDAERGSVLELDGIDDFVSLSSSNMPSGNTGSATLTIATWVKLRDIGGTPGVNSGIYGEYDALGSVSTKNFLGVSRANGNVFYAQFAPSGGDIESPGSLIDNVWHHVAYVQNETGKPSRQLYIDGQIVASDDDVESYTGSSVNTFAIGARFGNSSQLGAFSTFIDGRIDDLRFYDSSLSSNQINNLVLGIPEPSAAVVTVFFGVCGISCRRRI